MQFPFKTIKKIKSRKGETIFKRWHLFSIGDKEFYLHKICVEDAEPFLHDHPWDAWLFVLWGGYTELLEDNKERFASTFSFRKFKAEHLHKITKLLETTYTLAMVGPRRREWGFLTDEGWKSKDQYFKDKWQKNLSK